MYILCVSIYFTIFCKYIANHENITCIDPFMDFFSFVLQTTLTDIHISPSWNTEDLFSVQVLLECWLCQHVSRLLKRALSEVKRWSATDD